ncbi:MAG: CRISPR-associated endoribonuclease Cas6 [candidate division WOR-3 bacterium]
MKIKIVFKTSQKCFVPLNYQQYLTQFVYENIGEYSREYANFLSKKGYQLKSKTFKMFCFSFLYFEDFIINEDKIIIEENKKITWYFASPIDKLLHCFIDSILKKRYFSFCNQNFYLLNVDAILNPFIKEKMLVIPESVIVFSKKIKDGYAKYIVDDFNEISRIATNNLQSKFFLLTGKENKNEIKLYPIVEKVKTKLVIYKDIKIKGIFDNLIIEGDKTLIEVAYHCGLGEKNSMGFGSIQLKSINF